MTSPVATCYFVLIEQSPRDVFNICEAVRIVLVISLLLFKNACNKHTTFSKNVNSCFLRVSDRMSFINPA